MLKIATTSPKVFGNCPKIKMPGWVIEGSFQESCEAGVSITTPESKGLRK